MKLIVGLGNPGKKYEGTRHNVGFMVIDAYCHKYGAKLTAKRKFHGMVGELALDGQPVILLKPETYMNRSGEAVRAVQEFYGLDATDILIVHDDLDLPTGKIRVRQKGSAGGHNGLKSIIEHLGTEAFHRLKIGIDRPASLSTVDYVLGRFTKAERVHIDEAILKSVDVLDDWVKQDILYVMNKYNG